MAPPPQSRSPDATAASTPELDSAASVSAAAAPSLPTDAIFEILSRTPIKSLCRFRCASREWRALIAGPAFLAAHNSRVGPLPLLAGRYYSRQDPTMDGGLRLRAGPLPLLAGRYYGRQDPNMDGGLRLMDVDGKVVREIEIDTRSYQWPIRLNLFDDRICLLEDHYFYSHMIDVATGEVLFTAEKLNETTTSMLPHQRNVLHTLIGAGHAAQSGTLKLVRLSECLDDGGGGPAESFFQVLELDHGAAGGGGGCRWRDSHSPPTDAARIPWPRRRVATVDGVVHFLARQRKVLRFDLETEQWRKMVGGPPVEENPCIVELNGAVCMVAQRWLAAEQRCIDIWRLADPDNSIWVKAYTVPTNRSLMPLMVTPGDNGGKLLFSSPSSLSTAPPALLLYDLRDKTWSERRMPDEENLAGLVLCRLHLEHFVV